jgi:hypothetical protein
VTPEETEDVRQHTCWHEAGHATIATVFGIAAKSTIILEPTPHGKTQLVNPGYAALVSIYMAGVTAEAMHFGCCLRIQEDTTIFSLLPEHLSDRCRAWTEKVLDEHQDLLCQITRTLLEKGEWEN